jgi:hypothetical protein
MRCNWRIKHLVVQPGGLEDLIASYSTHSGVGSAFSAYATDVTVAIGFK